MTSVKPAWCLFPAAHEWQTEKSIRTLLFGQESDLQGPGRGH